VASFLARPARDLPGRAAHRAAGRPGDRFYVIRPGPSPSWASARRGGGGGGARPGEPAFGELALLFGVPRTADVVTREPVAALSLSREDFLLLFLALARGNKSLFHLALARVLQLARDAAPAGEGS